MTTTTQTDVKALESQHVLQTYNRQPVVFERGSGMRLYDDHGQVVPGLPVRHRRGVAGPCASGLAHALARSGSDARAHVEPVLPSAAGRAGGAADRAHGPRSRVLLQQRHGSDRGLPEVRAQVLAHEGPDEPHEVRRVHALVPWPDDGIAVGDVGRALSRPVSAADSGRDVRGWRRSGCARWRRVDADTAAIIVEPIQGEGGVRPCPRRWRRRSKTRARAPAPCSLPMKCRAGAGRTGKFLASPAVGLTPDLVALGKALGGGMPVGAAMVSAEAAETIFAGDHGTTYGGNLLACRAALVFLDELEGGLQAHVRECRALLLRRPARAAVTRARDQGRPGRGTDCRPRLRQGSGAGGGGSARTRTAHQSHGDHGDPAAAAVHRDEAGH